MLSKRKALAILAMALLVVGLFPLVINAAPTEIVLHTPDTYQACPTEPTSDTIYTTGVPADWRLVGFVRVDFVLDDGQRQLFHEYEIDQLGDLNLVVEYPPVSQWPPQSNGTREIHVDVSIEVYDNEGLLVQTLGPGQDWDIFCPGEPPPPPTATPTPPPPTATPAGGEGCTPGYWKNHTSLWDEASDPVAAAAGFTTGTGFNAFFSLTPAQSGFPNSLTMLDAVNLGGGGGRKLARHGVAALLNIAAGLNYPYSDPTALYNAIRNAYLTSTFEPLATQLNNANNLFCPLN